MKAGQIQIKDTAIRALLFQSVLQTIGNISVQACQCKSEAASINVQLADAFIINISPQTILNIASFG